MSRSRHSARRPAETAAGNAPSAARHNVPAAPRISNAVLLLAVCFFLSGTAALTLEVVWSRSLRLVFGSTTLAICTVLVAYMLGLGMGGLFGGRFAARLRSGVRVYGWMEIAIGVYALCVPWMLARLATLDTALLADTTFWSAAMLRFFAVLVLLFLPTVLMGATLPILVGAVVRSQQWLASQVGLLYGVNTLGAVTGVFGATFLLFPLFGLWQTNLLGALLAIGVGLVAIFVVAPRFTAAVDAGHVPSQTVAHVPVEQRRWSPLLLSYGTVGFTALAYEVCWARALAMVTGSSIYAFATMLGAFLAGIALGSLVSRRWSERLRRPHAVYAVGVATLGLFSLLTILALGRLPRLFVALVDVFGTAPGAIALANVGISLMAMLAPTLVLGALFPLLLRALGSERDDAGRTVGDVYFVNTIGCAAGAFAAGFLLIPGIGLQRTMSGLIALNFLVGAALLLWQRQWMGWPRRGLAGAFGVAALLVLAVPPGWVTADLNRGVYQLLLDADEWRVDYEPLLGVEPDQTLMYREGINTTVAVERRAGALVLRVNGKPDAGTEADMPTQVLLGHVPMLFGGRAERVMVLGLASGITVGAAALHEPAEIDVVELEPAMVDASRFFDHLNHRPLQRDGVRVILEDGRIHLARRPQPYDVIISEPSNPWISGVSSLFTQEFFRAARAALKPDGRLLQWVQLYGLSPSAWASILAAIHSEFPYVYVFLDAANSADSLVLASGQRLGADDFPRWEDLDEEIREDLRRIGTFSTADLWSLLRLGPDEVAELAAAAPVINSDDNMAVELSAPWSIHDGGALAAVRERLGAYVAGALPQLEAAGVALSDEEVGNLAWSYATRRRAVEVARNTAKHSRGVEPYGVLLEALLEASEARRPTDVGRLRADVDSMAERQADSPSLHWHRATVLRALRDDAGALADIDAFLAREPEHVRARAQRVRLLFDLGRMAEARTAAEPLLASRYIEFDWDLLPIAAVAAARQGDYSTAIADLRRYLEGRPGDAQIWRLIGELLVEVGEGAEATIAQENAVRVERNLAREEFITALRLRRFGEVERAAEMLRSVRTRLPDFEPAERELRRTLSMLP